jgi:hypothetical protein
MARLEVESTNGRDGVVVDLTYDESGRSFSVRPTSDAEVCSILVNDLEIHVDTQGRVILRRRLLPTGMSIWLRSAPA